MSDLLPGVTGVLVLADGTVLQGAGCGAIGAAVGEVCFNTAMTGYQEILTDPSYMAQVVAFTFPHVGNVGVNGEDVEEIAGDSATAARGAIFRDAPTPPANWRSETDLGTWMARRGVIGISGVDTRALSGQTMESRQPGLYFIGEVVDVTGWLGGYNFQWAWASGYACAQAMAARLRPTANAA